MATLITLYCYRYTVPTNDFKILCDILSSFNLNCMIRWPTRVTDITVTTIDKMFCNFIERSPAYVTDNSSSDHRTVLFDWASREKLVYGNLYNIRHPLTCHLLLIIFQTKDG